MFKVIAIALAGAFAMGMAACNGGEEGGNGTIGADPVSLTFTASGDVQTVTVTSSSDWSVTEADEWIDAVKSADNTLTVTVGTTDAAREGKITIANVDGKEAAIGVKQNAPGTSGGDISVDPPALTFTAEGGIQSLTVTSDTDWGYVSDQWIDAVRNGLTLDVTVEASDVPRNGKITITNADGKEAIVNVTQDGPVGGGDISVDPTVLVFTAEGDTQTVTVTSGSDWSITGADQWIDAAKTDETTVTIIVGATDTAREGKVTIKNEGGKEAVLTVKQDDDLTIDDMVGTWHITEKYLHYDDVSRPRIKINNHALVMTKESDTRLKIQGFAGYWAAEGSNFEGSVIAYAEFDTFSNTFTLLSQNLMPTWGGANFSTHLSGIAEHGNWEMSRDIDVSAVVDENFSFMLYSLEAPSLEGIEGETDYIAYHVSEYYQPDGGTYIGLRQVAFDSQWVRHSDSVEFPPEWWWKD